MLDHNDDLVEHDEEHNERVDEGAYDDAPHPAENLDEEGPWETIGYAERTDETIQAARKGPWIALSATKAPAVVSPPTGGVCAQCGGSYAIRMLGECPHCQANRNRRASDELAKVIRELKGGRTNPEQERRLVKQLREMGHPAIPELLQSLEARAGVANTKQRSRL